MMESNIEHTQFNNGNGLLIKRIIGLIPAMLLANLSAFVIIQSDGIIVGNLVGEQALAAVNLFQPISFFVGGIAALLSGCPFLISNAIGKNDEYKKKAAIKSSMVVAALAMAIILVLEVPVTTLVINGFQKPDLLIQYALPYYATNVIGCINVWGTHTLVSFGKTKHIFAMSLIESLANVIFDLCFVGLLDMGIIGAAFGTLAANLIRVLLTFLFVRKVINIKDVIRLKLSKNELKSNIKDIVKCSIPLVSSNILIAFQSSVMNGLFLFYYGIDGIIVSTINRIVLNLATLCYGSVVSAGTSVIGMLRGASEFERYKICVRFLIKTIVIMGAFFTVVSIIGYQRFYLMCGVKVLPEIAATATLLFSIVYIPRGVYSVIKIFFTYEKKIKVMTGLIILQMVVLPVTLGLTACYFMPILIFGVFGISDLIVVIISILYLKKITRSQLELKHQIRLVMSINRESVAQASSYAVHYFREKGIDDKAAFYAGLCIEEMVAYLPELGRKKNEILLLLFIEDNKLVFHMICNGQNLHLDSLEHTPVDSVILNNNELIYAMSDSFSYQYVLNLNNITVIFNLLKNADKTY